LLEAGSRWRRMQEVSGLLLVAAFGLLLFATPAAQAQGELNRKAKTKVSPAYPELARRLSITGTVRIQVVVTPNGDIKDTKVIGGHPLLVSAAMDALKKWRFEPAEEETKGTVEFNFDPH